MSGNCLPPPGTASGTTHVLRGPDGDMALIWDAQPDRNFWRSVVWCPWFPRELECSGYRYLGPLTPPEEVARLRAENERLREAIGDIARSLPAIVSTTVHRALARAARVIDGTALEPPHD